MHHLSRRAMLGGGASAAASALVAARALGATSDQAFFRRNGLDLGIQLYVLGDELVANLDPLLAEVARIGYRKVELAGFLGRSAAELRAAFDRAGLTCRSAHIPDQAFWPGQGATLADVPKLIDDAQIIGLQYIVLPMFPLPKAAGSIADAKNISAFAKRVIEVMTPDDWKACADMLNKKGAVLAQAGLKIGYHNHNCEFAPNAGGSGYEILMERTDPALVTFELDAGWVCAAGLDPVALLKAYPDRFKLMHVKDIKALQPNFTLEQDSTEVGSGVIDWPRILPAAFAAGITEYYVEQEPPFADSRIAAVEKSFRYLNMLRL